MARNSFILTLDAGSGSGRAVVFDAAGNQVSLAQTEWLPKTLPAHPGSQVFDTAEAWKSLAACVRACLHQADVDPSHIIGVSATGMREGMVLYDRDKKEIWACSNVDARAEQEVIELIHQGVAEKIYKIGGDWLSITSAPRFRWIKKHQPAVFERIAHVNMISDWILFKLSGNIITDPTIGSSSGIFDLRARTWSDAAIEMCDLPPRIYPSVYEPGRVIGSVTEHAAVATGLLEGTPVVTGGADTQMALLGVGSVMPNCWTIVAGTFWQTTVIWDRPLIDPEYRVRTLCHVSPDRWMTEGVAFLVGQQARWLRDAFCQEETQRARQTGANPYELMEKLADKVPPGANGVIGLFSGIHNARHWKHAAPSFVNFNIYDPLNSGKAECIRALWESAAYASYGNLMILKQLTGTTPQHLTFCGGSANGFLWPQIVADVFGIPIRVPVVKEATSLGSAMCVGVALGKFTDFYDAAQQLVKTEHFFEPDLKKHQRYLEHYARWKRVYEEFMKMVDEGLLTPMWRAPGT